MMKTSIRPKSILSIFNTLALTCFATAAGVTIATSVVAETVEDDISKDYGELAPPDLSAFALIGIDAKSVQRPASAKDFSVALLNGLASQSGTTPGFAIEWSPAQSLMDKSIKEYRRRRLIRSLVLTAGSVRDSQSTRLGFGFRWVPVDRSDPYGSSSFHEQLLDYVNNDSFWNQCKSTFLSNEGPVIAFVNSIAPSAATDQEQSRVLKDLFNPGRLDTAEPPERINLSGASEAEERILDTFKLMQISLNADQRRQLTKLSGLYFELLGTCRELRSQGEKTDIGITIDSLKKEFKNHAWNATILQIAAGTVWRSVDASLGRLSTERFASYAGICSGFGNSSQWILQASYDHYLQNNDTLDWSVSVGGKFLYGSSSARASGEIAYAQSEGMHGAIEYETFKLSLGGEIRIAPQIWLDLSLGSELPKGHESKGRIISLASLKWGFASGPKIGAERYDK